MPPPTVVQRWSFSSNGTTPPIEQRALKFGQAESVQTHTQPLDLSDARSRGFSEQEATAVLPFEPSQRLDDAAAAPDGTTFAVAVHPVQLFSFKFGPSSAEHNTADSTALPTVTATELETMFPRHHGELGLQLAALDPAIPGCVAVLDQASRTVLVVDPSKSTAQVHIWGCG